MGRFITEGNISNKGFAFVAFRDKKKTCGRHVVSLPSLLDTCQDDSTIRTFVQVVKEQRRSSFLLKQLKRATEARSSSAIKATISIRSDRLVRLDGVDTDPMGKAVAPFTEDRQVDDSSLRLVKLDLAVFIVS